MAALALDQAGVDRFRSAIDTEGATAHWVEATRNPDGRSWTLMRHQKVGDDRALDVIYHNACFFDALYYCAGFDLQRKLSGGLDESAAPSDAAHYTKICESAHIPVDRSFMPHPVSNGKIMTKGGVFDEAQLTLAARGGAGSGENLPALRNDVMLETLVTVGPQADAPRDGKFLERSIAAHQNKLSAEKEKAQRKKEQKRQAKQLARTTEGFERFNEIVRKSRESNYGEVGEQSFGGMYGSYVSGHVTTYATITILTSALAIPMTSVPAILFLYTAAGIGGSAAQQIHREKATLAQPQFNKKYKKLANALEKLPDGPDKKLVDDFMRAAGAVFALGYVEHLQGRIGEGKGGEKKLKKLQDEGLKVLDAVSAERGWSDEIRDKLKSDFMNGAFPETAPLFQKLEVHFRQILTYLENRTDALMVADGEEPFAVALPAVDKAEKDFLRLPPAANPGKGTQSRGPR